VLSSSRTAKARFQSIESVTYFAKFRENIGFGCLYLMRCLCDFLDLSSEEPFRHRARDDRDANLGVGSPRQASPSRSSHIRTFVARPLTDFSHHESEGGTLSGLGVAKASGG
jgi:hypothetical protein